MGIRSQLCQKFDNIKIFSIVKFDTNAQGERFTRQKFTEQNITMRRETLDPF